MQATSWTPTDETPRALALPAESRHQLAWYVAFALLTTLAETMFLVSSMPSLLAG